MKDSKQCSSIGDKDSPLIIPSLTAGGLFGRTGLPAHEGKEPGTTPAHFLVLVSPWVSPSGGCFLKPNRAETWNSPERSHSKAFFHRDLVLIEIKLIYKSLLVTVDWNDDEIVKLCQWCPINIWDDLSETFFFSIASKIAQLAVPYSLFGLRTLCPIIKMKWKNISAKFHFHGHRDGKNE